MSYIRIALLSAALIAAAPAVADEKITEAAMEHRARVDFDGEVFSGAAFDQLVAMGAEAQFFLVGEEHGIAENPMLVGQLFTQLAEHGYSKLAIEISPTMAKLLDEALIDDGLNGLRELFARPGGQPAFFGMAEEAEMLATARDAVPGDVPLFWGTDYEVAGDRQLLRLLEQAEKPAAAKAALDVVIEASESSWAEYEKRHSPEYIFSFAGDPDLVRAVRDAWPDPDAQSAVILNTLEATLAINQLWMRGKPWESNHMRAGLQVENFLRYWRAAKGRGERPKVMAKYGASHMVRGLSPTAVYDLGTLLPAIAEVEGGTTLSLMIVPGADSMTAGLNPNIWRYESRPAAGGYIDGLSPLMDAAFEDAFTLIDLRALRAVAGMKRGELGDEVFRVIHGFDFLLVMSGSTPSTNFSTQ